MMQATLERRPLWCAGLAVAATALLEARLELTAPWFLAMLPLAAALVAFHHLRAGLLAALVAIAGVRAASVVAPASLTPTRTGSFESYRGTVQEQLPGGRRAVVLLSARLQRGGWVADTGRLGVEHAGEANPGDSVEFACRLTRPRPPGNPGDSDPRHTWWRRGLSTVGVVLDGRWVVIRPRDPGHPASVLDRWRGQLLQPVTAGLPPEVAVLAGGFLLGVNPDANPAVAGRVRAAFREAGAIHLLVVSGTQVTLIGLPFIWLGWRMYRRRAFVWTACLPVLLGYGLLTGAEAPVLRAVVFGALCVLGLGLKRQLDVLNALGGAALVLWVLQPLWILDVGAQLSFAAVWALAAVSPALSGDTSPNDTQPGIGRELLGAFAAAVAVQVVLAPVLSRHFQSSCWSAVAANLVLVPLAGVFTYSVLAHALLTAMGWTGLAGPTAAVGGALLGWAGRFAEPPFGSVPAFPPETWGWIAWGVHLLLILNLGGVGWRWLAAASLALALNGSDRASASYPALPTVRFLDVGQGDAVLLEEPSGRRALVDCGPPAGSGRGARLVKVLRGLRISRLDLVALTHPHADHIGGWEALRTSIAIDQVLPGWPLSSRGSVAAGTQIPLGRTALRVLSSSTASEEQGNETSLVLRWETTEGSVLLPGDAGRQTEADLIRVAASHLPATLLKVGHHGSAGATSREWLEAVRPLCAVISCGEGNAFGHPSPEVLERLRENGVAVFRTDTDGMVTAVLSGGRVIVQPWLRRGG